MDRVIIHPRVANLLRLWVTVPFTEGFSFSCFHALAFLSVAL
jgi:hypothetical protein